MLFIAGAGGFGRETYDAVLSHTTFLPDPIADQFVVRFLDDKRAGQSVRKVPVLSPSQADPGEHFVVAIANPDVRSRLAVELMNAGLVPRTIMHRAAIFGPESTAGVGCVFLALCHVSSTVTIGNHVHVNYNATIGHDAVLEDFVTVLPGANVAGSVLLKEGSTVGSGAVILPGIVIGPRATIGAGAVVTRDVMPDKVVKGVPAR